MWEQKDLDYPLMGVVKIELPCPDKKPVPSDLVNPLSRALVAERSVTDERGQVIYVSLKKVEGIVKDIDDKIILNLYNKIFRVFLSGIPHQQINPDDYFAFLQRLGTLLEEATAQANEAHLTLREAIGHEPVIGRWGGVDLFS